jgi:hypothetical protein
MPRFVVLQHDHPTLHWDFMLESAGALRTWRLAHAPQTGIIIPATAIKDHRLDFLDYEGPVSGNRGHVTRWDRGDFEMLSLGEDKIVVWLAGERIRGNATLEHEADDRWRWELVREARPVAEE